MEKNISRNDTARSWRAMRMVICCIAAIANAVTVFVFVQQETANKYNIEAAKEQAELSKATEFETSAQQARNNGQAEYARQYLVLADTEHKFAAALKSQFIADEKDGVYNWFWRALGLGVLGGIGGWVGAWLLIVSIAFIWWFTLDRIREFSRAIRGQP